MAEGERHTITLDQLDRLSIDAENQLYWDGAKIVTELSFDWAVQFLAIGVGIATIGGFLLQLADFVIRLRDRRRALSPPAPTQSQLSDP